jgi:Putative prokaryotic signal transducing protein
MEANPFVTVATYSDLAAAHLARTCLEAAGLDSYVAEEDIALMTQLDHSAVGGVKLKVRASDRDEALEILRTRARPL